MNLLNEEPSEQAWDDARRKLRYGVTNYKTSARSIAGKPKHPTEARRAL